jgi:hypothetical protein
LYQIVHGKNAGTTSIGHDQELIAGDRFEGRQCLRRRKQLLKVVDPHQTCAPKCRLHGRIAACPRACVCCGSAR